MLPSLLLQEGKCVFLGTQLNQIQYRRALLSDISTGNLLRTRKINLGAITKLYKNACLTPRILEAKYLID